MRKKFGSFSVWSGLVIVIVISFLLSGMAAAQESGGFSKMPLSPEFTRYVQMMKAAKAGGTALQKQGTSGHQFGYVPPPFVLPQIESGIAGHEELELLGLPKTYDLRTTGKLTEVRDQGQCGSCWAFGSYAALESYLLPGETTDFSEHNLMTCHGFDPGICAGGNLFMTTAYLSRWNGPVLEQDDAYDINSYVCVPGTVQKHIQEALFIPRKSATANTDIKKAVMTYGAVAVSMFMYEGAPYLNSTTNAYYFNLRGQSSNHMVAIVGWDDNYSKINFSIKPKGNGAFIVRNSWGSGWGEAGYFYVSYYDTVFALGTNGVFDSAAPTTNYAKVYEYDPLGVVTWIGAGNSGWGANIFQAGGNENLAAVAFYTPVKNSSYNIYIYTNVTAGSPRSGTLVRTIKGKIPMAGYHTINVPSVSLAGGQNFSVVVKLTTPGFRWPAPIEYPESGYSSGATAQAGQSFLSSNGKHWYDLTTLNIPGLDMTNANLCVKAFTN